MTPKIVGAKYRVVDAALYSDLDCGDIITMIKDDGTDDPLFVHTINRQVWVNINQLELVEQPKSDLYTQAEELWQTLNAVNILLGGLIPFETRQHIEKVLKTCNPSLNKTINNEEANS